MRAIPVTARHAQSAGMHGILRRTRLLIGTQPCSDASARTMADNIDLRLIAEDRFGDSADVEAPWPPLAHGAGASWRLRMPCD